MYKIFLFYCLSAEMTSEAFIRYEKKLADEVARIAFRRTVINTFSISLGTTNYLTYNLFSGDIPCRIFIGK